MKTAFRLPIICAMLSVLAACSDSVLEHKLAGKWVAEMEPAQVNGNPINGTLTLILDAENLADTLIVDAPGSKGLLDSYSFAGTWGAVNDEITLNLSNKLLQDHTDMISAKVDSMKSVIDSLKKADPEFNGELSDDTPEVAELKLLEALRKNVGCRSTMTIIEYSDSILVLGDNNSSIRFIRR